MQYSKYFINAQFNDALRALFPSEELVYRPQKTDSAYIYTIAIPGVKKSDLDISVQAATGFASDSVTLSFGGGNQSYVIPLPEGICDLDAIGAKLEDGILTLTAPFAKSTAPRKVVVA